MRAKDIVIGKTYKLKNNPYFIEPLKILKPKEEENVNNYIVVKCVFLTSIRDKFGIIKYFKPSDIVEL